MKTHSLAIASISWARDAAEENLLTIALTQLSRYGIPMFITDAGSHSSYIDQLIKNTNCTLKTSVKGVWLQAKTSLKAAVASGAEWIFYTEPDKVDFFANNLSLMLQEDINAGCGVLIASRSPRAFASFPAFQQMTETTINKCCVELMGKPFDYVYGPFLLHRNIIPYLDELPNDIDWGWRPYAFLIAQKLGYKLQAFTGDFLCPTNQQMDSKEERVYRMRQLAQNLDGLALAAMDHLER